MYNYTRKPPHKQANRQASDRLLRVPTEAQNPRHKAIIAALQTINHTAVKIEKYGRYIAPVAA